jgi:hypothetical protein
MRTSSGASVRTAYTFIAVSFTVISAVELYQTLHGWSDTGHAPVHALLRTALVIALAVFAFVRLRSTRTA